MWIVAGVLLGLVVFSSIFGFHIGPHAHAVAAVAGIAAAGFLIGSRSPVTPARSSSSC